MKQFDSLPMEKLQQEVVANVKAALAEDVGTGDVTAALLPADETTVARLIGREQAVL